MELNKLVISSEMIGSTEYKVIDNITEELKHVLYHNDKDTHIYIVITEECGDVNKVMGEVLSLLTGNGLCDLLCKQYPENNLKCTIVANHAHTGNYIWDEYATTVG